MKKRDKLLDGLMESLPSLMYHVEYGHEHYLSSKRDERLDEMKAGLQAHRLAYELFKAQVEVNS